MPSSQGPADPDLSGDFPDLPFFFSRTINPDLPFLAFLEKAWKTTQEKARIFLYAEPLKFLGKKGKNAQKGKEIPCKEKKKARKSEKARKGRSGNSTYEELSRRGPRHNPDLS